MLSENRRRDFATKSALERDLERSISDLLWGKESGEPIRVGKKIIKTPDSETTITYELTINPRTGQQEVIENISTTKNECAICGGYFSQVQTCQNCGARVCASDARQHTSSTWIGEGDEYDENPHNWLDHRKTICKSCAGER